MCLWEDDGAPDGPDGVGGPNGYSLIHGQRRFLRERRAHDDSPPGFCARPPARDEPRDPDWTPHPDSLRDDLVLGWTSRGLAVELLGRVAALTGCAFTDGDAATIASKLPATDVYQRDFVEWGPSDSDGVIVRLAVAPEDDDVSVRVVTSGDATLAERVRALLEDAV